MPAVEISPETCAIQMVATKLHVAIESLKCVVEIEMCQKYKTLTRYCRLRVIKNYKLFH